MNDPSLRSLCISRFLFFQTSKISGVCSDRLPIRSCISVLKTESPLTQQFPAIAPRRISVISSMCSFSVIRAGTKRMMFAPALIMMRP